jgi:lipid-A-disaccharide synthase
VGLVTELVARALVRTESYALPNVLLGRRAFTELLQRDVNPRELALAIARALDTRGDMLVACDAVLRCLGAEATPSLRVAELLLPWLQPGATRP